MFEYLISVKSMKDEEYYKEKNFYVEADSAEEAIRNAVEFFIDEEDYSDENPLNIIGLETKIVSYSEAEDDYDEEENDDELSFNITIKPIHNNDELKELSNEICND